jgi:hypothetical protein
MLDISGLYHTNPRTQVISPNALQDFVNELADTGLFDIDKNNTKATLTSFETSDEHPDDFAQKFTMHLKLKNPIVIRPESGAPAPARS